MLCRHLRGLFVVVAASAPVGCVMHQGDGVVQRDSKQFSVSGEPDVTLETFDGSLRIQSWDRNEVLVEIEKRGASSEDLERLDIQATQDGDRIRVAALPAAAGTVVTYGNPSPSVAFVVNLPRRAKLRAETGDGSVEIGDLEGDIDISSGDGSITAQSLRGRLQVTTGDGSIRIIDADGAVEVDSGDGSVHVDGRLQGVRVSTADGSVRVEARDGSAVASDWDLTTGDGSIVLRLPVGVDAEVDAESADGRVDADGTFTTVRRSDEGGWLRGRLGRGGRAIRLRSGDGAVRLIAE
jgi:DUF4097 and DUF4098 domain-containing protein YvlB